MKARTYLIMQELYKIVNSAIKNTIAESWRDYLIGAGKKCLHEMIDLKVNIQINIAKALHIFFPTADIAFSLAINAGAIHVYIYIPSVTTDSTSLP